MVASIAAVTCALRPATSTGMPPASRSSSATMSLAEWQAMGQDKNSLIADPLFVDPEKGDFRLRPGSPAAQIGFEPWDFSRSVRALGPAAPK